MIVSDAVLINLITTLGSLFTAVTTTLAVILSGKRTRQHVNKATEDVRRDLRGVRNVIATGDPGAGPLPAIDVERTRLPQRDNRQSNDGN